MLADLARASSMLTELVKDSSMLPELDRANSNIEISHGKLVIVIAMDIVPLLDVIPRHGSHRSIRVFPT